MPHQEQALEYLRGLQTGALFMEMRLGKTLVVIRRAQEMFDTGTILVVAPYSVLAAWQDELDEENELWLIAEGGDSAEREANVAESANLAESAGVRLWVLVNYARLRATPRLTILPWDLVVLDESTHIKNPNAQITRIVNGGRIDGEKFPGFTADNRIILSGLPHPESPLDLFEQFRFLDGGFCGHDNWYAFRSALWKQGFHAGDWYPAKDTLALVKKRFHARAFVLRRLDALDALPSRFRTIRSATMPAKLRKQYDHCERYFEWNGGRTKWKIVLTQWLARFAGGFTPDETFVSPHKMKLLVDLLCGELKDQQVVVWFRFTEEEQRCRTILRKAGLAYKEITGATPLNERRTRMQQFRDGELQVLGVQVACGQYGLDLSAADTAIYYSNSYSYEMRAQSEDRIFHPQKTRPLAYIDLVSDDTVDRDVVRALRDKRASAVNFMSLLREQFERRRQCKDA